jgi:hypothetical protein
LKSDAFNDTDVPLTLTYCTSKSIVRIRTAIKIQTGVIATGYGVKIVQQSPTIQGNVASCQKVAIDSNNLIDFLSNDLKILVRLFLLDALVSPFYTVNLAGLD